MAISLDYLNALKDYLEDQATSNPPAYATIGTIKVGSFQASPEQDPCVVTLHTSNPENAAEPHWRMILDQGRLDAGVGGGRHRVWGAYQELGGGSFYWYNWWLRLEYYMNRQGLLQDEAAQRADEMLIWLSDRLRAATPQVLSVTSSGDELLMETKVVEASLREAGGTTRSYIYHGLLKIQGLVYHE